MIFRALALTSILWSGTAAAADEALAPTGKWVVDFADAQCVATRNYGSESDPIYLILKAPSLGSVVQVGIVRKGTGIDPQQVEGEIIFDDGSPVRTNLLEYGSKKLSQRALLVNLPDQHSQALRTAKVMRIRARDRGSTTLASRLAVGARSTDARLALSQMPQLLQMMETCLADLRRVWHVSGVPGPNPDLREEASGNLNGLFSPDDYPAVAIREFQMGTLRMVLLINESGRVADCTVVETSGVASLDTQSCAIAKERAKFKPAVGIDGKPAKSAYVQSITWRLQ